METARDRVVGTDEFVNLSKMSFGGNEEPSRGFESKASVQVRHGNYHNMCSKFRISNAHVSLLVLLMTNQPFRFKR